MTTTPLHLRAGSTGIADPLTDAFAADVAGATHTAIHAVASLATRDASDQPWSRWLLPDDTARDTVLHAGYTALTAFALRHGHVDVIGQRAAAVWLDHTLPVPDADAAHFHTAYGASVEAMRLLLEITAPHQPGTAHLHLAMLAATDRNDAAALLAHRHLRLDRAGVLAHTYATSREHHDLLTAAGYEPGPTYRQPTGGPAIWPMLRTPRPRRQRGPVPGWPPDFD